MGVELQLQPRVLIPAEPVERRRFVSTTRPERRLLTICAREVCLNPRIRVFEPLDNELYRAAGWRRT